MYNRVEVREGEVSASREMVALSTSALSTGMDRVLPPTTPAVNAPCATYTVTEAEEDAAPTEAVTVMTYALSTVRVYAGRENLDGSRLVLGIDTKLLPMYTAHV